VDVVQYSIVDIMWAMSILEFNIFKAKLTKLLWNSFTNTIPTTNHIPNPQL